MMAKPNFYFSYIGEQRWKHVYSARESDEPWSLTSQNVLYNPINPLFQKSTFRKLEMMPDGEIVGDEADLQDHVTEARFDISNCLYRRMVPALRLVSIWLERARPMLVRIIRGKITHFSTAQATYDPAWQPNEADERAYDDLLIRLSTAIQILRLEQDDEQDDESAPDWEIYGNAYYWHTNSSGDSRMICIGAFPQEMFDYMESVSWENSCPRAQAACLFHLAQALLCITVDAIYAHREELQNPAPGSTSTDIDRFEAPQPRMWPFHTDSLATSVSLYLFGLEYEPGPCDERWDMVTWLTHAPLTGWVHAGTRPDVYDPAVVRIPDHELVANFDALRWESDEEAVEYADGRKPQIPVITIRYRQEPEEPDGFIDEGLSLVQHEDIERISEIPDVDVNADEMQVDG